MFEFVELNTAIKCFNCDYSSQSDSGSDYTTHLATAKLGEGIRIGSHIDLDRSFSGMGSFIVLNPFNESYKVIDCWICSHCNNYNWIIVKIENSIIKVFEISENIIVTDYELISTYICEFLIDIFNIDFITLTKYGDKIISSMIKTLVIEQKAGNKTNLQIIT